MNYPKYRNPKRKRPERTHKIRNRRESANPASAETEASYLKFLVDSRKRVTVAMKNGEKFQGRIRYYDQFCFSVGLSSGNRKIFLRKENVSYIAEE